MIFPYECTAVTFLSAFVVRLSVSVVVTVILRVSVIFHVSVILIVEGGPAGVIEPPLNKIGRTSGRGKGPPETFAGFNGLVHMLGERGELGSDRDP